MATQMLSFANSDYNPAINMTSPNKNLMKVQLKFQLTTKKRTKKTVQIKNKMAIRL
jgi:hypothetical protein